MPGTAPRLGSATDEAGYRRWLAVRWEVSRPACIRSLRRCSEIVKDDWRLSVQRRGATVAAKKFVRHAHLDSADR
jgi:hypothetical protein